MVKEFKKELSKLSGVDFFNPKYRDVFKKYFPDENTDVDNDEDVKSKEEERIEELLGEETTQQEDEVLSEDKDVDEDEEVEENTEEETEQEPTDAVKEEDTAATVEEAPEIVENDDSSDTVSKELLETKVELELLKAGVRKDRLEAARILIMGSIHSVDDLAKVSELIKQYPEWLSKPEPAKPFGIPLENVGGYTEEEKRLKEMGIDPRS